ncbi:serine--tRNA ligase [Sinomicrobium weinanense]|uniref:Serine--tRNA ligase n=1 Tax=Sinomicrobium weinanense TaxID=2842200 RepID=A0A926Q4D0_9FLAO|nr:serine--tRNA ligase [Sinomicrobium weinanense]MBC9796750.1 serine--tRNA ligase [Sinomicrobium weinanense]MBU3124021.1 serine--tRNA ligase [Sinomicrobium weinanense]
MLQLQFIRENKDQVIRGLEKRNLGTEAASLVNEALRLDEERRGVQASLDSTLAESNKLSKEIGNLFKSGEHEKANELKEKTARLKTESKELNEKLNDKAAALTEVLYKIPNVPHDSVPPGNSDEDNVEVFRLGEIPELEEGALPHWELAKKYDLIDFDLGSKITGAGFPVYKGKGARLQRALISYFLDKNREAGYFEYFLPYFINEASGYGTGQLPDKEGQMYYIEKDDLYVIPTGEVPMINCFRDTIVQEDELPIKATTHTPCFRREAGSYGAHVRGLNRLHQFEKVEIIQVTRPEASYQALEEMIEHVKGILKELDLPYRILQLCGGDLGFTSAITYDFEVFSTAQDRWLEISSVSNCEDYQSNRLKLRYKNKEGKMTLCHALNGSSLAIPRVLAGILENYQDKDGIKVPEVLIPYTGFDRIS